jgi:hypothetical protein
MAAQKRSTTTTPDVQGVNFLSIGLYSAGYTLPEGDYWWEDCTLQMHSGFGPNAANNTPKLGVMIKMHDLGDLKAEPRLQFYGLGAKAHLSFSPDPTGKMLVPIPGAPAFNFSKYTNFGILLESLVNSEPTIETLPNNNLGIFDGLHVHMQSVPEPKERAGFSNASTGEAAGAPRKEQTVAIVTAILEGGKPWEGGGGAPKGVTKPAVAGKVATPTSTTALPSDASDDEDLMMVAINGLSSYLDEHPAGASKLLVRISSLKHVSEKYGEELCRKVESTFFANDSTLNVVLGKLGYTVAGPMIKTL